VEEPLNKVCSLERFTKSCTATAAAGSTVLFDKAWCCSHVSRLHGWTRDSPIGPGWRETLTAKEGHGWSEDPRQWATGQAAQLTGVEMCNARARCQTRYRMLLGATNL
jgi:hypothetical protein